VELSGAQILMQSFMEEGVDTIFGYPGGSVLDIYDELYKSSIKHILVRHEQGAAHAADGYARSSGKVGVCLVTSGPGATNTVTGIATAYMDSIPMVIVTGQVPTPVIGTDAFQEADITGITRPCTKHNFLVRRVDDLANTVREAFYIARSGRPGPVLIDLPKDVMQATAEYRKLTSLSPGVAEPVYLPDAGQLTETLDLIKKAKRPVLLIGGALFTAGRRPGWLNSPGRSTYPLPQPSWGLGPFPGPIPCGWGCSGCTAPTTRIWPSATVTSSSLWGCGFPIA